MQVTVYVELDWLGRLLWKGPERISVLRHGIERVNMEKLSYVVVKQFLEAESGILNTVHEITRALLEEFHALFKAHDVLGAYSLDLSSLIDNLDGACRHLSEHFSKLVSRPFNTVKSFFGEHLESAVRDLVVVLGVVHAAITLSLVRQDHLHVAFSS